MWYRKPGSKYNNEKTFVGAKKFDSKKEAARYQELLLLQKAKKISSLRTQVRYKFEKGGVLICAYVADFVYLEKGVEVVEDVKSAFTRKNPVYRIKKKMMLAFFGIDVREV